MHKCVNNSIGNVYHLEQFVSEFFPYSQKQLGFDQPVTIRFESDQNNAGVMLGKTAYYDPDAMEVALYVDGRHPKDVMRSLSHELVHHAQNCRGDFEAIGGTETGYAQKDPHMRKMEQEAYTKGNLIFRDFEDLIKTGKINIEIDFSNSGEPKMSLKEWKNNEIGARLMKKWGFKARGFLKESYASERGGEASFFSDQPGEWADTPVESQPELEFIFSAAKKDVKDNFILQNGDLLQAYDLAAGKNDPSAKKLLAQIKQKWLQHLDANPVNETGPWATQLATSKRAEDDPEDDPADYTGTRGEEEEEIESLKTKGIGEAVSRKISVREAKEITRRIIERIRKENK